MSAKLPTGITPRFVLISFEERLLDFFVQYSSDMLAHLNKKLARLIIHMPDRLGSRITDLFQEPKIQKKQIANPSPAIDSCIACHR
jgi:hypothetical protein